MYGGRASFLINYKEFDMENTIPQSGSASGCQPLNGVGWLDKSLTQLTIEYEMYVLIESKTVKFKFIGTRVK